MSHRPRAQILVELALALPLVMLLILGATEIGFLVIAKAAQDRATSVVAWWAADHPGQSWNSVAGHELPGCEVSVTMPLPDLVEASALCHHAPVVLPIYGGLPISSREAATTRNGPAPASPSLSPAGFVS